MIPFPLLALLLSFSLGFNTSRGTFLPFLLFQRGLVEDWEGSLELPGQEKTLCKFGGFYHSLLLPRAADEFPLMPQTGGGSVGMSCPAWIQEQ